MDINALEKMESSSSNSNFGSTDYFSLKEGESAVLRFITGMVEYISFTHRSNPQCNHVGDVTKAAWDNSVAAGQAPLCPSCGQPILENDVDYVRPDMQGGGYHYVNDKGYMLCANDPMSDITVPCPLCETKIERTSKKTGKTYFADNNPTNRLAAYAVVREIEWAEGERSPMGIPTQVISNVKDHMVQGDDGMLRPQVVMVSQTFSNFWKQIKLAVDCGGADPYANCMCWYDWEVQRVDDRTYSITPIAGAPVFSTDYRLYAPYMKDLVEHVKFFGSFEHYVSSGLLNADGSVATPGAPAQAAQGYPQAAPQYAQAPQMAGGYYAAPQVAPAPQAQYAPQAAPVQGGYQQPVAQQPVYQQPLVPQAQAQPPVQAPQAAPAPQVQGGVPQPPMVPQAQPQAAPVAPQAQPPVAGTVPYSEVAGMFGGTEEPIPFQQ